MKVRFLIAILFSLVLATRGASAADVESAFDFRNTSWGMSRAEVILSEKELPTIDEFEDGYGRLRYGRWTDKEPLLDYLKNQGFRNIIMEVEYVFSRDALLWADVYVYYALMHHADFDYIGFYDHISDWLEAQHPNGEYVELWKDQPKEGNLVALVYLGELTRITRWITSRTAVILRQELNEGPFGKHIQTKITFVDPKIL